MFCFGKKFQILATLFCAVGVMAGEVRYDLSRFVEEGLNSDPQLAETRFGAQSKQDKIAQLKAEAILPTFYVGMMVGPAPGLRDEIDNGDTTEVYDFSKMGPYWGVQARFVQPLNLGQYRAGKAALEADLEQKKFKLNIRSTRKMWNCRLTITTTCLPRK